MFDTSWVNRIDWSKRETYDDLYHLFYEMATALEEADVTSKTNSTVDGFVKAALVEKMRGVANTTFYAQYSIIPRPPRNLTQNEGHRKDK